MAIAGYAGEFQDFSFTGAVEPYVIPVTGIYKLEAWGAGGGNTGKPGGRGGYSVGYGRFNSGETIYVCVGGTGKRPAPGFNGGGAAGTAPDVDYRGAGGGGATHFARVPGTLAETGGTANLLLVAGGGGGASCYAISFTETTSYAGGDGGGESGAPGEPVTFQDYTYTSAGGTQSSGYAFGQGQSGESELCLCGGGGGGLFGGTCNFMSTQVAPGGGGGSGYAGGLPAFSLGGTAYAPSTAQGAGSSPGIDGTARITLVTGGIPVIFNGKQPYGIALNGVPARGLVFNGVTVY